MTPSAHTKKQSSVKVKSSPSDTYDFVKGVADQRFLRLIQGKKDIPDTNGNSLLMHYAWLGDVPKVTFLCGDGMDINARNNKGDTALHKALHNRQFGMMVFLLQQGANPNLPNGAGWTPMHLLAKVGRVDVLSICLQQGGDPAHKTQQEGWNCWHIAAHHQQKDLVSWLIDHSAPGFRYCDKNGRMPIDLARAGFVDRDGHIQRPSRAVIGLMARHQARYDRLVQKAAQVIDAFAATPETMIDMPEMRMWQYPQAHTIIMPLKSPRPDPKSEAEFRPSV